MNNEPNNTPAGEEMPVLIPDDFDANETSCAEQHSSRKTAPQPGEGYVPYTPQKLKGKEAWDNFLYHHKNKLIAVAVAIALLAAIYITSIPTKYDYHVAVYADTYFTLEAVDEITADLLPYGEDVDGNGKVTINTIINNSSDASPYSSIASYMFIDSELKGDYNAFLIVTDQAHYDYITESYGAGVIEALEGCPALLPLKDSDLIDDVCEKYGNNVELYLALLSMPEEHADDSKMQLRHDSAAAALQRIVDAHPEMLVSE